MDTWAIWLWHGVWKYAFWTFILDPHNRVSVYLLIKWLVDQNKTHREEQMSALEIAKTRYAKGEITEKEFKEIKKRII